MAGRGRPRSFDREVALARAMETFWIRGYETASMAELTTAMGINSPSLYAAFGSKEQLFREAVELYNAVEGAPIERALTEESTAYGALAAVLRWNARAFTRRDRPTGCLVVLSAVNTGDEAVRRCLAELRAAGIDQFRDRLDRGVREGDLPEDADTATAARFYTAVVQGMAVQARDGAGREELERMAERALAAWSAVTGGPVPGAPTSP
ncbi:MULTISPECIES: TetR/AcrR family transcriptional regulator [Streptomyces]|uniref:TetR/AcrR family transcriptional regulator n=1 Tax=Streptomyces tsukubensis (strain DSM 42081 / NBRC 108919 / NRRL 18488 / 9993) TaxID=1114943 RepID=I2MV67_STRT9|nr:TetR/AcrR family transcriptional regulator [Streptomyces tsukubensis]MYS66298.1 TetR family transcriptional regulator [Streptomyces sp. SID5473]AZK93135.1 TetR family transcriptional regulator [Streptomyces tsukubensis]EIF88664.1 TetR family transcriptional regulator [Streptomyces tsukubensis NRRL18488]QKM70700.1 TetR/AcrR family transcriptional regulator [Streptomyces tsukubensis NRRL18488]TAI41205.1 TetR/AcrR family transcriptional regulator [Streptomyces tsukubensis]